MTTSAFHPVVSSTAVIRLQRIDVRDNKIARIRGISPYHKHMATAAIPAPTYHQRFAIVNLPADDCSACGTIYHRTCVADAALDKARLTSVDKSPVTLAQEDEFFPHFTYWHWEELLPPRYTDTLFDVAAQHQLLCSCT